VPAQRSTVLLVDDEKGLREVLARALRGHLPVVEADNGASALQVAGRLADMIGLVVTDINMPVMDGLEFARVFRLKEPPVPILFVTGQDPAFLAEVGFHAEVLPKPFNSDRFIEIVMRLITGARSEDKAGVQGESVV
jgi:CheY-like chemotaxis protein